MDNFAAARDAPVLFGPCGPHNFSAGGFDDLAERFPRMPGLQNFILSPFEVELQHWNAPFIHDVLIDFAPAIVVGDHFAAAGKTDERSEQLAAALFEFRSVPSAEEALRATETAGARHVTTAAELDVITAGEGHLVLELLVVIPPGHVEVHSAGAVIVVRRQVHQDGEEAYRAVGSDGIHQVATDHSGGICQTVWMLWAAGIQQQ